MKKLVSSIFLVSILLLNCSKSNDPAATVTVTLVGTWLQTSNSITSCTTPSENVAEAPCTTCATLVLVVDQTGASLSTYTNSIGPASGVWSPGGPITNPAGTIIFQPTGGVPEPVGFSQTATTLILTYENLAGPSCKTNLKFTRQ
jgi:hypothetical protein